MNIQVIQEDKCQRRAILEAVNRSDESLERPKRTAIALKRRHCGLGLTQEGDWRTVLRKCNLKTEIPVRNKEGGVRNHQRVIGVALAICLVSGLCGDWITNLRAATLPNPTLTKQQVELFGVGADVKVKLTSGKKLRGSIGGIDAQSFDLISRRDRSPRRITYDQVTQLKLAKLTYRASGPPNAEQARRVVVGLGVGKHVAVKVKSGKKFRGHLQAINEGHFVLLPDREAASIEIAYGDVQELGPNLSKGEKVAIIVVVVVAVAVAVIVAVALGKATEKLAETVGI